MRGRRWGSYEGSRCDERQIGNFVFVIEDEAHADQIGEYKKANNITILQTNRWNSILEKAFAKGEKLQLSKEFITKYYDAVHMESINHQNKIMNS